MNEKNDRRFLKKVMYEQFARLGKALSSPSRFELLDLIFQGPRTVEKLASITGMSIANTSQHRQVLKSAQLVKAEKEGLYVRYRGADDSVAHFIAALKDLAGERLAEIDQVIHQFLQGKGLLEHVDQDQLVKKILDGKVTVIDVRPVEEYEAGHISGSISIPLEELKRRISELPKRREVVAYCRGKYCVLALEAIDMIQNHGLKGSVLDDSIYDWKKRGLKISAGEGENVGRS